MNAEYTATMNELDARLKQYGSVDYRAGLGRYVQVAAISLAVCLIPIVILHNTGVLGDFSGELLIFGALIVCGVVTSIVAARPIMRVDADGINLGNDRYTWGQIDGIATEDGEQQGIRLALTDGREVSRSLPGEVDAFAAWLRSLASRAQG